MASQGLSPRPLWISAAGKAARKEYQKLLRSQEQICAKRHLIAELGGAPGSARLRKFELADVFPTVGVPPPFRQELLSNSVDIGRYSRSNYVDTVWHRAVWEIT